MTSPSNDYQSDSSSGFGTVIGKQRLHSHYLLSRISSRVGSIDYRMVLLGSLLPDIIDKPVWLFITSLTGEPFLSGRAYAHSLLFNLALFIGGLVLIGYRKPWLVIISLSSFMHLILDQMWNRPAVLLWPLLGPVPERETAGWLFSIIQGLFSLPEVYIPEIIGLAIIALFAYRLVMRKNAASFIRDGAVS